MNFESPCKCSQFQAKIVNFQSELLSSLASIDKQSLMTALQDSNLYHVSNIFSPQQLSKQLGMLFQTHVKENKLRLMYLNLPLLLNPFLKKIVQGLLAKYIDLKQNNTINEQCFCNKAITDYQNSVFCLSCRNFIHKSCSYYPNIKSNSYCPKCFIINLKPLFQVKIILKTYKTQENDRQVNFSLNLLNIQPNQFVELRCVKISDNVELNNTISWPEFYKIQINNIIYKHQYLTKKYKQKQQNSFQIFPTQYKKETKIKIKISASKQKWQKTKRYPQLFAVVVFKKLTNLQFQQNLLKVKPNDIVYKCSLRQRFKPKNNMMLSKQIIQLNCPITKTRMRIPVRGNLCYHTQCFDLNNFLDLSTTSNNYKCPVFSCTQKCYSFVVDPLLLNFLNRDMQNKLKQITIDENGNYIVNGQNYVQKQNCVSIQTNSFKKESFKLDDVLNNFKSKDITIIEISDSSSNNNEEGEEYLPQQDILQPKRIQINTSDNIINEIMAKHYSKHVSN